MNEIDKVQLLASLTEEQCELNHGPGVDQTVIPAVDYIVIPFGLQENDTIEISKRELVIPVCHDCLDALMHNEWTLLYCFECSASRWVNRKLAKNRYRHHILWMRGCPDCSNEFGGLYFNDLADSISDVKILKHKKVLEAA